MKIYLDLVFLLNFLFDFLLLTGVTILLRRHVEVYRILLGALLGGLSIFILFIKVTSLQLFFLKVLISIGMSLITFGYRDIRYTGRNLFYLYSASMILGGFLYFLNVQFSYRQEGLVFYHHGLGINMIVLVIFSPLILYTYVKQGINLKNNYAHYYQVDLFFKGYPPLKLTGFMDTGNQLLDPYFHRPIILLNKKNFPYDMSQFEMVLVPYDTVNHHGLLKCVVPEKIEVIGKGRKKNVLIGLMEDKIGIDGVDCILQPQILEG